MLYLYKGFALSITQKEFIIRSVAKHGNKYDYSLSEFKGTKVKVKIICKNHGVFLQRPEHHFIGKGCSKCGHLKIKKSKSLTNDEFIEKAVSIHGYKYDYSRIDYENNHSKLKIICKTHGEFEISGNKHIQSIQGCQKCSNEKASKRNRFTVEEFIDKANIIHGFKYGYSSVRYKNNRCKIKITCKIHGYFMQTAGDHLSGRGCQSCAKYGFDDNKPAILYYLSINSGQAYKIGITNKTVEQRFSSKDLSKIKVINTIEYSIGIDARKAERTILREFKFAKWSDADLLENGNSELFKYDVLGLDSE